MCSREETGDKQFIVIVAINQMFTCRRQRARADPVTQSWSPTAMFVSTGPDCSGSDSFLNASLRNKVECRVTVFCGRGSSSGSLYEPCEDTAGAQEAVGAGVGEVAGMPGISDCPAPLSLCLPAALLGQWEGGAGQTVQSRAEGWVRKNTHMHTHTCTKWSQFSVSASQPWVWGG